MSVTKKIIDTFFRNKFMPVQKKSINRAENDDLDTSNQGLIPLRYVRPMCRPNRSRTGERIHKWTEEQMAAAVQAYKEGRFSKRDAAHHYGIPRTQLDRRLKGLQKTNHGGKSILGDEDEFDVVRKIVLLSKKKIFTVDMILKIIYKYCEVNKIPHKMCPIKKGPSMDWYRQFAIRHPVIAAVVAEGKMKMKNVENSEENDVIDDEYWKKEEKRHEEIKRGKKKVNKIDNVVDEAEKVKITFMSLPVQESINRAEDDELDSGNQVPSGSSSAIQRQSEPTDQVWLEDKMAAAIEAVEQKRCDRQEVANLYGVSETELFRVLNDNLKTGKAMRSLFVFTDEQELDFVSKVVTISKTKVITEDMMFQLIYKYCEVNKISHHMSPILKRPNLEWFRLFTIRNPEIKEIIEEGKRMMAEQEATEDEEVEEVEEGEDEEGEDEDEEEEEKVVVEEEVVEEEVVEDKAVNEVVREYEDNQE